MNSLAGASSVLGYVHYGPYHHYGSFSFGHYDIGHMIISAIIHALIYGAIYKLFAAIGLKGAILVAIIGVAIIWFIFRSQNRRYY